MREAWELYMSNDLTITFEEVAGSLEGYSFEAARGIGQGTPASPFVWDAFFDILLVALRIGCHLPEFLILGRDERLLAGRNMAYSDDAFTPAHSLPILQRKADIVSAFSIIFGLDVSVSKLRTTIAEWGREQPELLSPVILVHSLGWISTPVGVGWDIPDVLLREYMALSEEDKRLMDWGASDRRLSSLKYLGTQLDNNNRHEKMFKDTKTLIVRMCGILRRRRASPELKRCTIYLCVMAIAAYRGKHGPWSLEKLREWDRPLEALYRHFGKWTAGHPRGLMYANIEDGGEGYRCLSDWICELKFRSLQKCLYGDEDSAAAADGLLRRMGRYNRTQILGGAVTLYSIPSYVKGYDASLWVRPIVDLGSTVQCNLHFGGDDHEGGVLESIEDNYEWLTNETPEEEVVPCQEALDELQLGTYGDLTIVSEGERKWMTRRELEKIDSRLKPLADCVRNIPVPAGEAMLKRGSTWLLRDNVDEVVEIMGWIESELLKLNVRYWEKVDKSCGVNDMVVIRAKGLSRGAGAGDDDSFLEVHRFLGAKRVYMSKDIVKNKSNRATWSTRRKILCIIDQGSPNFILRDHKLEWTDLIPTDLFGGYAGKLLVYTDGSSLRRKGTLSKVFRYDDKENSICSGVVIMTSDGNWKDNNILAIKIGPTHSSMRAFDAETIAAAVGACVATALGKEFEIITDCKALYNAIEHGNLAKYGKKPNMSALQALSLTCEYVDTIRWTRSHPEKRTTDRDLWTRDDYGIFMADRVAAEDWKAIENFANLHKKNLEVERALQLLASERRWHWTDSNGAAITDTISDRVKNQKISDYANMRDAYRIKRGEAPIWEGTKGRFASLQFELINKSIGEVARCVRIIWNKGLHGGNVNKYSILADDACSLCGEVDSQYHWTIGCQDDRCVRARLTAMCTINELKSALDEGNFKGYRLINLIQDWAISKGDEAAARIWTGLWSPKLLAEMEEVLNFGIMDCDVVEDLHCIAISVGRALAKAAICLWEIKMAANRGHDLDAERLEHNLTGIRNSKLLTYVPQTRSATKRQKKREAARVAALSETEIPKRVNEYVFETDSEEEDYRHLRNQGNVVLSDRVISKQEHMKNVRKIKMSNCRSRGRALIREEELRLEYRKEILKHKVPAWQTFNRWIVEREEVACVEDRSGIG